MNEGEKKPRPFPYHELERAYASVVCKDQADFLRIMRGFAATPRAFMRLADGTLISRPL